MGDNRESWIAILGFDNSQVIKGLEYNQRLMAASDAKMLAGWKKLADDQAAIQKSADAAIIADGKAKLAALLEMEANANARRAALARENISAQIQAHEAFAAAKKGIDAQIAASEAARIAESRTLAVNLEAARLAEIERVKAAEISANAEIIAAEKARNDWHMQILGANKQRNATKTIETSASGVGWFGAGKAASGAGEAAEEIAGGVNTRARSEIAVLFREFSRGN